ncbi:MAG: sodium:solute symporter family protein [Chloroflexi bacterium]|nr:sodium:solute symporter family protein [Chloroflexota bacterium]
MAEQVLFKAHFVDYLIIFIYFVFVLGIGFLLKRYTTTGKDFFLSGRSMPGWVAGLAFLGANLGALELLGMAANSYQHGIQTVHFYWIGAIPAMLFLAIFMMPFYYGSRVRSVPEYLSLRFNEATRGLNAVSFAIMTVLMSGISLYSMAIIFQLLLGWNLHMSIILSAAVVLVYVVLGGLTSSIFNEVIQFFLIWLGLLPLPILGLRAVGGWDGVVNGINNSTLPHVQKWASGFLHAWGPLATTNNSMDITWLGTALGLGFVLSFGYWCTDFLVIQRAFSANSLASSQRAPIYASFFKMAIPLLVVTPGLLAIVLLPPLSPEANQVNSYNMALPLLMQKFYPPGLIGLGITALLAGFMSGMAGNVTAFTTVWTYDIYQAYINKKASDKHYVWMGRAATIGGVIISIFTAYIVMGFATIMDYMQLIFSFVNAPLFATFLLGMFWKRATPWGGFWGLVAGIGAAILMYVGSSMGLGVEGDILHKLGILSIDFKAMGANFWRAWWAWCACFGVTILVSFITQKRTDEELSGLCWGFGAKTVKEKVAWHNNPVILAIIASIILIILNIIFF